ncbi:MAG: hypothetical protein QG630_453 [Patescibacteria group bacterium]|nr:hypothetical protein [Patescibacteria group bacterium]
MKPNLKKKRDSITAIMKSVSEKISSNSARKTVSEMQKMAKVKTIPKGIIDPKDLLKNLPGRGRTNKPPIPREYYDDEWGIYATDENLKQGLSHYMSQKQDGECKEIFYKGKKLDIYVIPPEGLDFVKEKMRNLGIRKSEKNFILHRKLKPKTSQWTLCIWK